MNKEYKNENTGSLWLADKETKNGDKYYNGSIFIGDKEHKITMFINNSDNPKAPAFRLLVNEKKEGQAPKEPSQAKIIESAMNEESDPFKEFGIENPIDDGSLPF